MTLPFEQDQWLTLIKLNGEGFTDYYLNIYGKDKINSGSKVLVHTSENYELCNSDEFTFSYWCWNELKEKRTFKKNVFNTNFYGYFKYKK